MQRFIRILLSLALLSFMASCAQQSTKTASSLDQAESQNAKTIRSSIAAPERLTQIKRIAVFVAGSEAFYTTMMEDALSIELQNLGFDVAKRLEIDKRVTKDWQDWYALPDSVKLESPKTMNEVEIGRLVDADAILTGIILEGRQQYSVMSEGSGAGAEKIVITSISLQLVDVKKEEVLMEMLIGYRHGKSILWVAEDIRDFLSARLKK